jgi:hypothetical protein
MNAVARSNINHVGSAVAHAPGGHTAGPDGHRRCIHRCPLMTAQLENHRQGVCCIFVIVDDQYAAGRSLEICHEQMLIGALRRCHTVTHESCDWATIS